MISKFRGGVSDENKRGISGSFKYGQSLDIHSRDDVLICGSSVVTVDSSTITDLIQFMIPSTDGSMYCFGSAGSIYSVAGDKNDPAVNFVYNDEAGNILGAAEFQGSDGITYMHWSTASQVSRRDMSTGEKAVPWTNVSALYKTEKISSSAVWHTMKVASGQLNIANAEGLASLSFAGDFDPFDLNIRPGNLINCIEERDDYILLGSQKLGGDEEGHLWSWITTATNWVQKKKIPIQGINSIIDTELKLLQGGDDGEIFFSDLVNSVPIASVPGGGRTNPGGVTIHNDLALFGFYGGTYPGLWSYGRKNKNRPFALNYSYRLAATVAGSSVSSIGAVTEFNGIPFASWGTTDGSTSDYGIDAVSSTTKASAIYEGLEFDGGNPHLAKTVDTIALLMSPLPSGTSVSAKFKLDKETDWRYAVLGDNATTFSVTNEIIALFNVGKPGRIYEVGIELNASGASTPSVQAIISYLSKENYEFS